MTDQNPYAPPQWDVPAPEPQAENAPGFLPAGRGVDAGRGFQWVSEAFELFKKSPGIWIVMFIVHMVIMWVLGLVPYVGSLAGYVLSPLFSAGYAIAAQTVVDQKPLELGALFAGFNKRPGRLFAIGGVYTGGILVAVAAFLGIAWQSFGHIMEMSKVGFKGDVDPAVISPLIIGCAVAVVIMIPISMAMYYAPALVALNDLGPGEALKASFLGASKNVLPFIVYSIVITVLSLFAAIPCFLGFLVLAPTLMAAVYTSYRDVFYQREQL